MREAQELAEPTYDYFAQPLSDNLFEWHFTVRGPAETEFDGGIYHGRIVLPPDYPMKPPNIIVLTPNGRFEVGKKICLSISGYHPETWQPSWSIRTALLAIIGFMPTPSKGTIGSLDYSAEERKKLAKKSLSYVCPDCGLVAELLKSQNTSTEDSITSTAEEAKEIIKTMSMKEEGTDEKKVDIENKVPVKEETEEERYKRARKLYSERMQVIIKKRLNQDVWLTQQNSSPSTDTSTSSHTTSASPRASSTSPGRGGGLEHQRQSQQQQVQSQQSGATPVQRIDQFETRNYVYDFVILIIAIVIGLLLYRRFTISMDVPTSPPDTAPEPGDLP